MLHPEIGTVLAMPPVTDHDPQTKQLRTQGDRLRYARRMSGLSLDQMATAIRHITKSKVSKSLISQWERGAVNNPQNENILAVQAITGFSVEWLVRGRGPQKVALSDAQSTATSTIDAPRLARAMQAASPDLPERLARTVADLYDLIGDTPDISDAILARFAATLSSRP